MLKCSAKMIETPVRVGDIPIDVTLEITRACPLKCLICSSNGGKQHPLELSLNKWIQTIDESIELGTNSFLISGGEPFLCSSFKDICTYISNKEIPFAVYTSGNIRVNGTTSSLSTNDLKFLSNLTCDKIIFNLLGSTHKTHDYMTQVKGSYDNTLSSIKKAISLKLPTEIHFVPTSLNYRELPQVVSLSKELGIRKVSILRFVAQGRGKENRIKLELNKKELNELRLIFEELEKYGDYVRMGSPFNPFLLSKQYVCTAGLNRITVSYDGFVFPCESFKFVDRNNEINIKHNSLKKIFNTSQLFEETRIYQQKFINDICKHCIHFNKCGGGCPAQKILYKSNIDPICPIYNQTIISKVEIYDL